MGAVKVLASVGKKHRYWKATVKSLHSIFVSVLYCVVLLRGLRQRHISVGIYENSWMFLHHQIMHCCTLFWEVIKAGAKKGMPLYYGWFILHFPLSGQVSVVSSTQAWGRSTHKTDSDDIVPNYWYLSVADVAVWLLCWNGRFLRSLALDWPPFPIMENGSCLSNFDIKIPWSGINKEEFNSSYDTCIMPGVLYSRLMCKAFLSRIRHARSTSYGISVHSSLGRLKEVFNQTLLCLTELPHLRTPSR